WERWLTRYENKEKYLGKDYAGHDIFQKYNERRKKELVADDGPLSDVIGLDLPSPTPFAEKER
ncbi:MAG TPA: cytochrome C, partial [Flexistipes sinusarabici]|nr:cytochrome C [Flexistipes sinusarabici]